jgi:hypothetical protein
MRFAGSLETHFTVEREIDVILDLTCPFPITQSERRVFDSLLITIVGEYWWATTHEAATLSFRRTERAGSRRESRR